MGGRRDWRAVVEGEETDQWAFRGRRGKGRWFDSIYIFHLFIFSYSLLISIYLPFFCLSFLSFLHCIAIAPGFAYLPTFIGIQEGAYIGSVDWGLRYKEKNLNLKAQRP